MIVYEFVAKDFIARSGYTSIEVRDGRLEFDAPPDDETLALIYQMGGTRLEEKPIAAKEEKSAPRMTKSGGKS